MVFIYFIVLQQSLILEWNEPLQYSLNLPVSVEEFQSETLSMCQNFGQIKYEARGKGW